MSLVDMQNSFAIDQQKKIMQQIQVINKKLITNPHSSKNINIQNIQNLQEPKQQKYFSQQCDALFDDQNYSKNQNKLDQYNDTLFSSNNDMLLGNQFDKQIKSFKQFQTNNFSSQNLNQFVFSQNPIIPCKSLFDSEKNKNSQNTMNTTQNISQRQSISKNLSQTNLNTKTKSIPKTKKKAESKIKNYIQNKENIYPASNIQNQKSYIKQVRKRIRFETQPDCYDFNKLQDSLELEKYDRMDSYADNFIQLSSYNYSKNRNKYDSTDKNSKNSLQCTFKPNILKKSHQIAENLQPSFQRLTQDISTSKSQSKIPYKAKQQLTIKKYSAKRLQQLSQPRKAKPIVQIQQQKYNFRPSLSKKSLEQMANCTMDVASRNRLWLQQKQAKLSKLKVQEEEKKLKKQMGPFAPKITSYKGESQVHLSRFTKQGISSYFERVSMAKQKIQLQQKKKPQHKQQIKEINVNMKKKSYDEAVKELHKKILAMNL